MQWIILIPVLILAIPIGIIHIIEITPLWVWTGIVFVVIVSAFLIIRHDRNEKEESRKREQRIKIQEETRRTRQSHNEKKILNEHFSKIKLNGEQTSRAEWLDWVCIYSFTKTNLYLSHIIAIGSGNFLDLNIEKTRIIPIDSIIHARWYRTKEIEPNWGDLDPQTRYTIHIDITIKDIDNPYIGISISTNFASESENYINNCKRFLARFEAARALKND